MKDRDEYDSPTPTGPAALAEWLTQALTDRGYNLSGQRSGGISRASEDSGISLSSMSRLVRGTRGLRDIEVYRQLARWLNHPLGDILIRAGHLDPADLSTTTEDRITPEQAADGLGLTGHERELFLLNVRALRTQT